MMQAGRFNPKVFVNCRVQGNAAMSPYQIMDTVCDVHDNCSPQCIIIIIRFMYVHCRMLYVYLCSVQVMVRSYTMQRLMKGPFVTLCHYDTNVANKQCYTAKRRLPEA